MTSITPEAGRQEREPQIQGDLGEFQVAELQRIEDDIRETERVLKENPSDTKMSQYILLAQKRKELFLSEHDNTGSFKFKRFGREARELFEDDPDSEDKAKVELKEGKIELKEGFEGKRILFVNMGELDRFNKEGGGHAAGDAALRDAAVKIEQAALEAMSETDATYELFRYSGTEFMLTVDGMDEEAFEALQTTVSTAEAGIPNNNGVEKVPLIATSVDMSEIIDMVNHLELEREDGKQIETEDEASREIVGVMKALADHQLDVAKFTRRAERIQQKLADAGDDPVKREQVRVYFENYMGKVFKGTGLESLDAFRPEDLDADTLREKAESEARKKRGMTEALESRKSEVIASVLKERRQSKQVLDSENFSAEFVKERDNPSRIAMIPELTEGQRIVQEMRDAAETAGDEGSLERQLKEVDAQIEDARRDRGTGLLERGEYYKHLEARIEQAKAEGKEVSAVFIDMGFLKYFDKKGGPDVGDAALKKGAELMTEALKGIDGVEGTATKGEVYRYGGDEFTVVIEGGQAEAETYRKVLEALKEDAGRIPIGKQGESDGYHPTELVFNYGTADSTMLDEVFESMKEAGQYTDEELADPAHMANAKAELMTLIADKGVEHEKAIGRFELLIEGLRDGSYTTDAARREQVDNMVTFSAKAIFAEKGGQKILEAWAASGRSLEELRPEITAWVDERVEERVEGEKKHAETRDKLVEVHARLRPLEQRVSTLEAELRSAKEENEDLREAYALAVAERDKVREDKQAIVEARDIVERTEEEIKKAS